MKKSCNRLFLILAIVGLSISCVAGFPQNVNEEQNKYKVQQEEQIVYVTRTGKKYHRGYCSYLSKSKIPIDKQDAIARGYTPCSRCNP